MDKRPHHRQTLTLEQAEDYLSENEDWLLEARYLAKETRGWAAQKWSSWAQSLVGRSQSLRRLIRKLKDRQKESKDEEIKGQKPSPSYYARVQDREPSLRPKQKDR